GNSREGRIQLRTERPDDRDNGDENTGRNETVFDRGGAGVVVRKPDGKSFHLHTLRGLRGSGNLTSRFYETVATLSKIISSALPVTLKGSKCRLSPPAFASGSHCTSTLERSEFPATPARLPPWPAWVGNAIITSHTSFSKNPKFPV